MVKIKGWKKDKISNNRYRQWNSIKGNVVTVENPPRGWVVHISTKTKENSYRYAIESSALNHAKKYMRGHPNG